MRVRSWNGQELVEGAASSVMVQVFDGAGSHPVGTVTVSEVSELGGGLYSLSLTSTTPGAYQLWYPYASDLMAQVPFGFVAPLAPLAWPDTAATSGIRPVVVHVLDNDEGSGLRVSGISGQGMRGICAVTDDGAAVTYTPLAVFAGTDACEYTVRDVAGQTAQAALTVTVTTPAPAATPMVLQPVDGEYVDFGELNFVGSATPGATVTVTSVAGVVVCAVTADAAGDWGCVSTVQFEDGEHVVSVAVTDSVGGVSEPVVVSFKVDITLPPAPSVGSPADGSVLPAPAAVVMVSGSAEPGATVTVSDGSTLLCSATADESGAWACTSPSPLSEGAHTFSVVAIYAAGHESAMMSVAIVQAGPAPAPPDDGVQVPNAGNDTSVTSLVAGLLAVGCGVLVLMVWKRRRDKAEFLSQATRVWLVR
jgi:hypothetical protein